MKLGLGAKILIVYMLVVCGWTLAMVSEMRADDGEAQIKEGLGFATWMNVGLAACGACSAGCMVWRSPWAWWGALVWALLQIPRFVDASGAFFVQVLSAHYQWVESSRQTINGIVENERVSGFGLNAVGVVLFVWLLLIRKNFRRTADVGIPAPPR